MRVAARFTMKPDPNMKSIIGQTAHNLDEVRLHSGSVQWQQSCTSSQPQRSQLQGQTAPFCRQDDDGCLPDPLMQLSLDRRPSRVGTSIHSMRI